MRPRVSMLAGIMTSTTLGRLVFSLRTRGSTSMQMIWLPRSLLSSLPETLTKTSPSASPVSSSTWGVRASAHFLYSLGKMTSVVSPSLSLIHI